MAKFHELPAEIIIEIIKRQATPRMLKLLDLPPEIILDVWDKLESPQDRGSFCRSCKALNNSFRNDLYQRKFEKLTLEAKSWVDLFPRRGNPQVDSIARHRLFQIAVSRDSFTPIQWYLENHDAVSLLESGTFLKRDGDGVSASKAAILVDAITVVQHLAPYEDWRNTNTDWELDPLCFALTPGATLPNEAWNTALVLAGQCRLPKICKYLIENGADPDALDADGISALQALAKNECPQNMGGDPWNLQNFVLPLVTDRWVASGIETLDVLRNGRTNNINYPSRVVEQRPHQCGHRCYRSGSCFHDAPRVLHFAAVGGLEDNLIKALIEYGADPAFPDGKGYLPLFYAMSRDHTRTSRLLMRGEYYSAKLENLILIRGEGSRPLHVACRFALVPLVNILTGYGHSPNQLDDLGRTPMHETLTQFQSDGYRSRSSKEVVKRLMLKGAKNNAVSFDNTTLQQLLDAKGLDFSDFCWW